MSPFPSILLFCILLFPMDLALVSFSLVLFPLFFDIGSYLCRVILFDTVGTIAKSMFWLWQQRPHWQLPRVQATGTISNFSAVKCENKLAR